MCTPQEQRRRDFEQQVVFQILRHADLIPQLQQFRAQAQARAAGQELLDLAWLCARYPGFPIRLGAILLEGPPAEKLADVFVRFTRTPLFRQYRQWRTSQRVNDRTQPAGIVFNLAGETMALHNYTSRWQRRPRLIRTLGNPRQTFVLEPLNRLLASLGTSWVEALATPAQVAPL